MSKPPKHSADYNVRKEKQHRETDSSECLARVLDNFPLTVFLW